MTKSDEKLIKMGTYRAFAIKVHKPMPKEFFHNISVNLERMNTLYPYSKPTNAILM
jgi:hypothetical protein